jgi:hypothetical protein
MARTLKNDERLVQIGQTAMRAPDGSFLPAIPMYIIVKAADVLPEKNLSTGEAELVADIGGLFAEKFAQYVKGTQHAGVEA